MLLFLLMLGPVAGAPPGDVECSRVAVKWIAALERGGCPPLGTYEEAATKACESVVWDGLDRNQKRARKALFKGCTPSPKGFPGVAATVATGRTLSRCGELVHTLRGEPSTAAPPTKPVEGLGYDRFMAAMASAVFACTDPNAIDLCRLQATTRTPPARIRDQQAACDSLLSPPLDTSLRTLAWSMGPMPVIPEASHAALSAVLQAQEDERNKRLDEDAAFQSLRAAEPERARGLADGCLAIPGDLKSVEAVHQAMEACSSLRALWSGDPLLREALVRQGILAPRYAQSTAGKVLNSVSLSVADPVRVEKRPESLKMRMRDLVEAEFERLIVADPVKAETLLTTYRSRLDPDFVAEATDRLLASE